VDDYSAASTNTAAPSTGNADLDRARAGDDAAFTRLVEPLRRELHAHCYRMLGSTHDADDALQDALLRAWRALPRFEGRSSLRTWLYTVATRTCLDVFEVRSKRALPVDLGPSSDHALLDDAPLTEIAWLGPYPDAGLGAAPSPAARYEQREAVELAFVAALQHLPGNQRAALLLFEVLGFSAAEIAAVMDTTVASVNSALQRARRIVEEKIPSATQQQTLRRIGDKRLQEIVAEYTSALERGDADTLVALLSEDVTWSMPPLPGWYQGLAAVTDFVVKVPMGTCGAWQHLLITANGQPAVAHYLLRETDEPDEPAGPYRCWAITVLTLRSTGSGEEREEHEEQEEQEVRIVDLTSFIGPEHFEAFGLPAELA
jgi:RNA polymerase sigma-70 factor, ECF subfamily